MAKKSITKDDEYIQTIEPESTEIQTEPIVETYTEPIKVSVMTESEFREELKFYDEIIRVCQEKIWAGIEVGKSNQTLKSIGLYCMALRRCFYQGGNKPERPII